MEIQQFVEEIDFNELLFSEAGFIYCLWSGYCVLDQGWIYGG